MKKKLLKIIRFFQKDSILVFLTKLALLLALIGLLMLLAKNVWSEVLMTAFGVLLSSVALYILKVILGRFEDMLKINFDTNVLLKTYKKETDDGKNCYKKSITLAKETSQTFAYDDVLIVKDPSILFKVEDHPTKMFQPDAFITENYDRIFAAHSGSAIANFDTVRMDDFNPETNTFYLSRSTYFNHLVTNRAVDYELFEGISLRNIYEFGPRLNPLSQTKMSNHVGINALVFLSDGRLLVPQRKADSTISKNKVTSSIAVMLTFPKAYENDPKNAFITAKYLLCDNIIKNLSDRAKLLEDDIDESKTDVRFLGFGRNIYEGGKPQMYFAVKLNNIDTKKYFEARKKYFAEQKRLGKKEVLDVDKRMFVVDWKTMAFEKDGMSFTAYNMRREKERAHKLFAGYEMSYLCNLWHYQQAGEPFEANCENGDC